MVSDELLHEVDLLLKRRPLLRRPKNVSNENAPGGCVASTAA